MLKSLSISWCAIDLRKFHIPWVQLQHLNLNYDASSFWNPVHSDYLQTLALCPNLTTLFLGIGSLISDTIDPTSTNPIEPVTLPHVHTLKTNIYLQTTYLAHLFDALRMPRLRHFEIKNVSLALGSLFTGHTECLPLLARCADTLESVSFNRVDIPDEPVLSCLEQLDHLRTLAFMPGVLRLNHGLISALACDDDDANGVGLRDRELHADGSARESGGHTGDPDPDPDPAGGRSQKPICPALESLHLRCSSIVSVDTVERMVASRRRTEPQLKQLTLQLVTFEYGLDTRDERIKEVQARLKPYVEDGLELVLSKSTSSNCGSTLG